MAEQRKEYRFEIDGFTPETLPIRRLQQYLTHLIEIFGNDEYLHLTQVADGSAAPSILVDELYITAVERRLLLIKTGGGPKRAYTATDSINDLLVADKTSARLRSPFTSNLVIEFPGIRTALDPPICVTQQSEVQGELFQIGGRDQTISISVRDHRETYICTTTRERGRDLAKYLFEQVRISGDARWFRRSDGRWKMTQLSVADVVPLEDGTLQSALEEIRSVLPDDIDAQRYIATMREDDQEQHE